MTIEKYDRFRNSKLKLYVMFILLLILSVLYIYIENALFQFKFSRGSL